MKYKSRASFKTEGHGFYFLDIFCTLLIKGLSEL
jgi:hypothetical protein